MERLESGFVLMAVFVTLLFPWKASVQAENCGTPGSAVPCSICGDYVCVPGESCPDDCKDAVCGDGRCEVGEACPDDCGESCGAVCGDAVCSPGETECPDDCVPAVCGDGRCDADESCPDDCSVCEPTCGDGDIEPEERCDDKNTDPEDGCNATCQIEPGFTCKGEPSVCTPDCVPQAELCTDGIDNDCDALVDCQDQDCEGETCAKGHACVTDALCLQGNCKAGSEIPCDDADHCTTDSCNPKTGCSQAEIPGCKPSNSPVPNDPGSGGGTGEEPGEDSGAGGAGSPDLQGGSISCSLPIESSRNRFAGIAVSTCLTFTLLVLMRIDRRKRIPSRSLHGPGR